MTDIPLTVPGNRFSDALKRIESEEDVCFSMVELVFVNESEIVQINRKHLSHDYVTDIITFPYDENPSREELEGTMYCCLPRILQQSSKLKTAPDEEILRVCIHGLLHLCGYNDQSVEEQKKMRKLEDLYLSEA